MLSKEPLAIGSGSGRLELAKAIASRDNPLTARVMANRVWLHLFGAGIVATPDNFGASGLKPSDPRLLDYLAVSFMDDGWSVKRLIRRIVLSRAYQLSSEYDDRNYAVDPDNALVWRMANKRKDAESLRDSMLAISGGSTDAPLRLDRRSCRRSDRHRRVASAARRRSAVHGPLRLSAGDPPEFARSARRCSTPRTPPWSPANGPRPRCRRRACFS